MAGRTLVQWRRHLRKVIRVAEGVERLRPSSNELRKSPLKIVTLMMLVQNRRLAQGIDRLVPESSMEAQLLQRAMFETWVNANWIRLRERNLRARRFLGFEPVEAVRLFESLPERSRPPQSPQRIAVMKRFRRQSARSLRKPNGKWWDTWALTKSGGSVKSYRSLESRIDQIEKSERKKAQKKSGRDYWLYRVMSQPAHGSPMGLSRLFRWKAGAYRIEQQPIPHPLEPMVEASRYLIFHLALASEDLTPAYQSETRDLIERLAELPVPSFYRSKVW